MKWYWKTPGPRPSPDGRAAISLKAPPTSRRRRCRSRLVANTYPGLFSAGPAISPSGELTYTPAANANGVATVTIELQDSGPGTAPDVNTSPTQDFDISVTAQPDTPSSDAIADQAVDELTLLSFTATATDPDVPETLTFTLEDGIDPVPAGALITAGGLFTWTPTEAQGQAVYNFVVRVTDSTARTDTTTVQITVDEVNVAPSLVDPGAQTDTEGVPVVLAMVATDPDLPANPLSYTASGLPPGLSINSVTGVISGTPTFSASAGSPYSVDVTVTDSLGRVRHGDLLVDDQRCRKRHRHRQDLGRGRFGAPGGEDQVHDHRHQQRQRHPHRGSGQRSTAVGHHLRSRARHRGDGSGVGGVHFP